eukprot:CAMPEP_0113331272 /NCGR_PEP_ID=MMETSP0010_2-20120614/22370_1 /TAXON_ID=216773 ORGANISM="Corethron hystrix, Strain 308" /NCGR_SAMPLE_ID=MMETSP0010_2 /ASSEMBLY_ACC=CAM_ASM_000155 /LENGTH=532 /DNA_ID=CAMNT_0000194467 /DNA_START=465 /DNA_END=2060 /DNA_ORIENTATION=- /assembly_acc=CAM_ASM_000155
MLCTIIENDDISDRSLGKNDESPSKKELNLSTKMKKIELSKAPSKRQVIGIKDTSFSGTKDTSSLDKKETSYLEEKERSSEGKKETSYLEEKETSSEEKKETSPLEKKEVSSLGIKSTSSFDRQEKKLGLEKGSAEHALSSQTHFSKELTKTTGLTSSKSDRNITYTESLQQGLVKGSVENSFSLKKKIPKQSTKTTGAIKSKSDRNLVGGRREKNLRSNFARQVTSRFSPLEQVKEEKKHAVSFDISGAPEKQQLSKDSSSTSNLRDPTTTQQVAKPKNGGNSSSQLVREKSQSSFEQAKEKMGHTNSLNVADVPETQQLSTDSSSPSNLKNPITTHQVAKPKNEIKSLSQLQVSNCVSSTSNIENLTTPNQDAKPKNERKNSSGRKGLAQLMREKSEFKLAQKSLKDDLHSEGRSDRMELLLMAQSTPLHNVCKLHGEYASLPSEGIYYKIRHFVRVCKRLTNVKDGNGRTPLHLACSTALELRNIKYLIQINSEMCSVSDNEGCLPLHKACQIVNFDLDVIRLLHTTYP